MPLPQSGVKVLEALEERCRWIKYRLEYHPWVTNQLPRILVIGRGYAQLMRLDRPIGIWLLLWPTLWAVWIAGRGKPDAHIFIIFVAGVVLMRSAGCVINDYADRSFDAHVDRTKDRPLATGQISTQEALILFALLCLGALVFALQLNRMTLLLAVLGAFLAVSYPFVKRFLSVPQMYLGVTFGWGIPMAFAAQLENVPRVAWLVLLANMLWVTAYDTMYAMADREDDRKIGVRSTAILFGDADRHIIAILQAMTLLTLYLVGKMIHFTAWYYCGLAAAAIFFMYQLWLIRNRDRNACLQAFLNNHFVGMSVFIGMLLSYSFARL